MLLWRFAIIVREEGLDVGEDGADGVPHATIDELFNGDEIVGFWVDHVKDFVDDVVGCR